ncbi:MAG: hypothetical protein JOZ69_08035 [Myxococcales bacterium]|nr:hypothetical protein [Myxococcales bacterium]
MLAGSGPAYVVPNAGAATSSAAAPEGPPPEAHASSGLACSAGRASLATKDASAGAIGAGALVVFLALARRRRNSAR